MSEYVKQVLKRIQLYKELKGYNDNDIAEAIGLTPSGYSRIINGERTLKVEFVDKVADVLKVPVESLFFDMDIGKNTRNRIQNYMREEGFGTRDIAQQTGINELRIHSFLEGGMLVNEELVKLNELTGIEDGFEESRNTILNFILLEAGIDARKISMIIDYIND